MSTRLVALILVGALSLAPTVVAFEATADSDLEEGIRQAQIGDFEKAVVTLDAAARRLAAEGGRSRDLARAYVYLSIAYLGLSQEQKAKTQFLEALKADTEMELDEGEFPPRILEFFEAAREEAVAEGVVEPTSTAPEATSTVTEPTEPDAVAAAPPPEKKGGSSKTLLLVGGGAAAAAGIALAAGGGGGGSQPTAPPQPVQETLQLMSTDVPREIPDLGIAESQLNVPQSGVIVGDGNLEFRIVHTCRNDVELELRHPDGTVWTARGPEDCSDVWEGPLAFPANGKQSNGVWILTARDVVGEDAGVLEVWGIRITIRR